MDEQPHPGPTRAASAFVVHLNPSDEPESVCGRVEHVRSGQWLRFRSAAELIGFMQQTLTEQVGNP